MLCAIIYGMLTLTKEEYAGLKEFLRYPTEVAVLHDKGSQPYRLVLMSVSGGYKMLIIEVEVKPE